MPEYTEDDTYHRLTRSSLEIMEDLFRKYMNSKVWTPSWR